jgi:hypothetical protein
LSLHSLTIGPKRAFKNDGTSPDDRLVENDVDFVAAIAERAAMLATRSDAASVRSLFEFMELCLPRIAPNHSCCFYSLLSAIFVRRARFLR